MILSWPRGKGEVFTAAACEWVAGLARNDIQVAQVTRNIQDRFGKRIALSSYMMVGAK